MTEERQLRLELMTMRLMLDHGLSDWEFEWSRQKRTFGQCFAIRLITISTHLAEVNTDERVKRTVLHEIAHALVGVRHGHDRVWRAECLRIGGDGRRCYDSASTVRVAAPWRAVCHRCGEVVHRYRRPRANRVYYCVGCGPSVKLEFAADRER